MSWCKWFSSFLLYLFQQTAQQPVSMEERVSIWENAFVLRDLKATNVKSVSSTSMCFFFTSTYSVSVSKRYSVTWLCWLACLEGQMPSVRTLLISLSHCWTIPDLVLLSLVTSNWAWQQLSRQKYVPCLCGTQKFTELLREVAAIHFNAQQVRFEPIPPRALSWKQRGLCWREVWTVESWELSLNVLSCIHTATWKSTSQTSKDLLFSEG